jgi:hypothetical protein
MFLKYTAKSHSAVGAELDDGGAEGRLVAETLESEMRESTRMKMGERVFIDTKVRVLRQRWVRGMLFPDARRCIFEDERIILYDERIIIESIILICSSRSSLIIGSHVVEIIFDRGITIT